MQRNEAGKGLPRLQGKGLASQQILYLASESGWPGKRVYPHPASFIAAIAGVTAILLAVFLARSSRHDEPKRLFVITLAFTAATNLSRVLLYFVPEVQPWQAQAVGQALAVSTHASVLFLFYFSISFKGTLRPPNLALGTPNILLIGALLAQPPPMAYVQGVGWGLSLGDLENPVMFAGTVLFFVYLAYALFNLWFVQSFLPEPTLKSRMKLTTAGILLMFAVGLPVYAIQRAWPDFPPVGSAAVIPGCILIYYSFKGRKDGGRA